MSYRNPLIVLIVFATSAVAVTSMVFGTLRRGIGEPTNTYSAIFTDVSGLHPGDDVRMAGVRVGRVEGVDLVSTLAKVTFQVEKAQTLYASTVASVMYQNIIGQRYLGLSPGGSADTEPLAPGAQLTLEHTRPSFDISYLLNGFEPLFSTLDPQQVDNLTSALIAALQGDDGTLPGLIVQTSALAETLAGPDQVLGDVIGNLNEVVTNLAGQDDNLQKVIRQTRDIVVTLANRRDELTGSLGSINKTVGRLATIINNVYPDTHDLIEREPGFAGYLAAAGRERASYFAANIPYLLKGLARITQEGTYADAYACDINSTIFAFLGRVIPAVVRLASPGNIVRHSGTCR